MPISAIQLADSKVLFLTLAVNHFISTGDYAGTAAYAGSDSDIPTHMLIPVNMTRADDVANFGRLRARLAWLTPFLRSQKITAVLSAKRVMSEAEFDIYELRLPTNSRGWFTLAGAIAASDAPVGWGTEKPAIDDLIETMPGLRRQFDQICRDAAQSLHLPVGANS
jgi:hypothetical protein